jgi:hypothetical protein
MSTNVDTEKNSKHAFRVSTFKKNFDTIARDMIIIMYIHMMNTEEYLLKSKSQYDCHVQHHAGKKLQHNKYPCELLKKYFLILHKVGTPPLYNDSVVITSTENVGTICSSSYDRCSHIYVQHCHLPHAMTLLQI